MTNEQLMQRLRGKRVDGYPDKATMQFAADEIERLRALVGRMLPYVQRWESADAAELEAQASIEDEAERVLYATHEPFEQRQSYVTFERSGAVSVDMAAYLKSPEGKAQLAASPDASSGEPVYRKWPGEPPHCMSCDCGMTDEQKRTVPLDDYLRIHRELVDLKYPGTAWDPNRCLVCGGNHGNLPCPKMTVTCGSERTFE